MKPVELEVNRQIGDYVVAVVKNPGGDAYAVRMASASEYLSFHRDATTSVQAILRYQKGDKRRAKERT